MSEFCALCGRWVAPGEPVAEQVRGWVQGPAAVLDPGGECCEPTGLVAHARCVEALATLDGETWG